MCTRIPNGSRRVGLRREDDFSKNGPLLHQFVPLPGFRKRQDSIDDRSQLASKNALHDIEEFAGTAHRGSEHLQLPEENVAKVGLGSKTRRGAASEHPATPPCGAEAAHPSLRADVIDDNIDAASIREVSNLLIEFVGPVIDQKVGAELFRALKFFIAARRHEDAASHHLRNLDGCRSYT